MFWKESMKEGKTWVSTVYDSLPLRESVMNNLQTYFSLERLPLKCLLHGKKGLFDFHTAVVIPLQSNVAPLDRQPETLFAL